MNSTRLFSAILGVTLCLIVQECLKAQTLRRLDLSHLQAKELKVLKSSGVANVGKNTTALEVRPTEMLFERLDRPVVVTRSLSAKGFSRQELPYRVYGVSPNGNNINLDVVVDVAGGGMRPSPNASSFVARLYFGVVNKADPASSGALPVPIRFLVTADVDNISPSGSLSLGHTNLPFVPLTLVAGSPGNTVHVHVRPSFSPSRPVTMVVDVLRPELSVEVSPKTIQGWGLEEAEITVRSKGMAQPAKTEVTLSATKGGLELSRVTLDAAGIASTKIRSIGLGRAKITVASSLLKGAETDLTFVLPWAFVLASIVGGILGALAKKLQSKRKGLKLKPIMLDILAGVTIGILGASAYAVGVNLTGYVPHAKVGEALIFFVSGVIAYAGHFPSKSLAQSG